MPIEPVSLFFFFTAPPTTEIYTLSLHDALPICVAAYVGSELPVVHPGGDHQNRGTARPRPVLVALPCVHEDRKSTRLNSSYVKISYAVFCLKKKKKCGRHDRTDSLVEERRPRT